MVYLDNAATTQAFDEVARVMQNYSCKVFFNPSAGYIQAVELSKEIEEARKLILKKLGASKGDIIFTGGATESNNLAIMGSVRNGKWEYVFSAGEHPSVFNTAKHLQELGYIVKFVPLQNNGQIDYEALKALVNEKTRLISVIHSSNETGAINDIKKINTIRQNLAPKALLHVDGVQAFCKFPFALDDLGVDLYTISAHKIHGPKGVGALYIKNKDGLKNIVYGGGQEKGLRSGTENVAGIMGMVTAIKMLNPVVNLEKVKNLKSIFLKEISSCKACKEISYLDFASPYVISLSFKGVNGETLMRSVEKEVIISTGSACSAKYAGNRVLKEIGLSDERIKSSVRVSFNAYQTEEEVRHGAKILVQAYEDLKERTK